MNIILKALLDPGDEVLVPAPYFVEYGFYADNHGGVLKSVPTNEDFTLNLQAIENAISERTKIVLINSPNNPTGQIYADGSIQQLGEVLNRKGLQYGRTIYLVADEPYRKIVYDGYEVPCVFQHYANSIIATSYSKDLSIPWRADRICCGASRTLTRSKTLWGLWLWPIVSWGLSMHPD